MAMPPHHQEFLEGPTAAALLAAGIGIFLLGAVTPIGSWLIYAYHAPVRWVRPVLSLAAFGIWGLAWFTLQRRWKTSPQPAQRIVLYAGALAFLGLLLGSPLLFWLYPLLSPP
ncbi:MAG: hypothetical protein GXO56_05550 [Chloroflexi bacterium]|nr:hypothetical protein [Chloroflexota bacterium]